MNKSKLILLLKSFSNEDSKKFKDFLNSPFFNKNKTVIKFYDALKISINESYENDENKNEKEIIYNEIFPGKKYNEQVIKNLTSELLKIVKEYFEISVYRNDKYEKKLNLLKKLAGLKADKIYLSELNSFENDLKGLEFYSDRSFHHLFMIEELKISYHLERNEQPKVIENVMNSGEFLILYFHLHLAKTISNLNVNAQTYRVNYEYNIPEEYFIRTDYSAIIKYMKDVNFRYSELFEMYFLRVISNIAPFHEENFFKLKELLLKNINSLDRAEVYGLFISLEAFCMRKINEGNLFFIKEIFGIYKIEIEKDFYKFSETSPVTFMKFRNTYLTALRLKEFDWANKFIQKFKSDLIESDKENVLNVAYAMISFENGEFEKTLEYIADISPSQLYMKIDVRNLTIMSYYELGYTESVLSAIDSFRHFLSGNAAISETMKESNFRFINSLYKLLLVNEKNKQIKLTRLKESLMPFIGERRIEWLLEKTVQ